MTPRRYPHVWRTYRYLLSDGTVTDVRAIQDASYVRAWVLEQAGGAKDLEIEGVAALGDEGPEP